jgi:hypothetical protein
VVIVPPWRRMTSDAVYRPRPGAVVVVPMRTISHATSAAQATLATAVAGSPVPRTIHSSLAWRMCPRVFQPNVLGHSRWRR